MSRSVSLIEYSFLSFLFAIACILLNPFSLLAQIPVPKLEHRVTDLTGTLSHQEQENLESFLEEFERKKGSQIAVLLVPTTAPETIEQFSLRVAETWKLGRKGIDDGVLLLIAKNDRRMRIEVGYGLEGILPDAVAKRIIAEVIQPHFREGNFYRGIQAGLEAIIRTLAGEELPPDRRWEAEPTSSAPGDVVGIGIFLLFFLFSLADAAKRIFGPFLGAMALGGGTTLLGSFFLPFYLSIFLGLLFFLISFLLPVGIFPASNGGGYYSGRLGRTNWGGGSSFGGRGGKFGGGGASGGW